MYQSVLQYRFIDTEFLSKSLCNYDGTLSSPLYNWLLYGQIPTNVSAAPTYSTQNIEATGKNRYLASIYISRIPVVAISATLAAAATATFTFDGAYTVTSSNTGYVTAAISNGVVTVTGVAAGTSVVTITDISSNVIATITVTVA